jgi:predicted transcriptional regulator
MITSTTEHRRRFLTSIRLDPSQFEALTKIAQRERRTTSWLIRESVDQFLQQDARKSRKHKVSAA